MTLMTLLGWAFTGEEFVWLEDQPFWNRAGGEGVQRRVMEDTRREEEVREGESLLGCPLSTSCTVAHIIGFSLHRDNHCPSIHISSTTSSSRRALMVLTVLAYFVSALGSGRASLWEGFIR